jgi:hypothetical protein
MGVGVKKIIIKWVLRSKNSAGAPPPHMDYFGIART